MVQELAELPGTKNMDVLRSRAQALSQWKISMQRGFLPGPDTLDWPVEPFQTSFVNALNNLGMPRFTRRYPKLLDSLLRQMMQLVHVSPQHKHAHRHHDTPWVPLQVLLLHTYSSCIRLTLGDGRKQERGWGGG